jgi:hypothetical protein
MWFAVVAEGFLVDMAMTEGNKQSVLKGNGGQRARRQIGRTRGNKVMTTA